MDAENLETRQSVSFKLIALLKHAIYIQTAQGATPKEIKASVQNIASSQSNIGKSNTG
jgi:hypothetical protein